MGLGQPWRVLSWEVTRFDLNFYKSKMLLGLLCGVGPGAWVWAEGQWGGPGSRPRRDRVGLGQRSSEVMSHSDTESELTLLLTHCDLGPSCLASWNFNFFFKKKKSRMKTLLCNHLLPCRSSASWLPRPQSPFWMTVLLPPRRRKSYNQFKAVGAEGWVSPLRKCGAHNHHGPCTVPLLLFFFYCFLLHSLVPFSFPFTPSQSFYRVLCVSFCKGHIVLLCACVLNLPQ